MSLFPIISPPAAVPAAVSFAAAASQGSSTAYTFSGHSIGTAAADRKVVVTVHGFGATVDALTVSTLTVGGISASFIVRQRIGGTGDHGVEIWQADVPTGTTADVVVTFAAAMDGCGIGTFAVTGAAAAANDTAVDTADPGSAALTIPAKGVAIGCAIQFNVSSTWTWTNLTEKHESALPITTITFTGASDAFATLQSALTITADATGAPTYLGFAAVSFGPA